MFFFPFQISLLLNAQDERTIELTFENFWNSLLLLASAKDSQQVSFTLLS